MIKKITALFVLGTLGVLMAFFVPSGESAFGSFTICRQTVSELLLANRISAPSQSYRKDNPTEYTKLRAYLEGGTRPSGAFTHMGMGNKMRVLQPRTSW